MNREVEKKTDGKDSEKVQRELIQYVESLGIDILENVSDGYDILMWKGNVD